VGHLPSRNVGDRGSGVTEGQDDDEEGEGEGGDETIRLGLGLFNGEEMVVPLNDSTRTTINNYNSLTIRPRQSVSFCPSPARTVDLTQTAKDNNLHSDEGGSTTQQATEYVEYTTTVYFPPEDTETASTLPLDLTVPVLDHSQKSVRTPSKATSKIRARARQSTPYKGPLLNEDSEDQTEKETEIARGIHTPSRKGSIVVEERKEEEVQREESFSPVLESVEIPEELNVFSILPQEQEEELEPDKLEDEVLRPILLNVLGDYQDEMGENGFEEFDPGLEMIEGDEQNGNMDEDGDEDWDEHYEGIVTTNSLQDETEVRQPIEELDARLVRSQDDDEEVEETGSVISVTDSDFGFAKTEELFKRKLASPAVHMTYSSLF
jgi:hypothetical protein